MGRETGHRLSALILLQTRRRNKFPGMHHCPKALRSKNKQSRESNRVS